MQKKIVDNFFKNFLAFSFKGPYIKYLGGGAGGFYEFLKKYFVAQETIDLNIPWPNDVFRNCFMTPPINFSFLFKAYL